MSVEQTFLSNVMGGVQAGGLEAIRQARLNQTKLIIWRDGKMIEITPDEAEAMLIEEKKD